MKQVENQLNQLALNLRRVIQQTKAEEEKLRKVQEEKNKNEKEKVFQEKEEKNLITKIMEIGKTIEKTVQLIK